MVADWLAARSEGLSAVKVIESGLTALKNTATDEVPVGMTA